MAERPSDHMVGTEGMAAVAGGTFTMGSADFYPDEAPPHDRIVPPFEIDRAPVTNAQFAAFVEATGHVTVAERELDRAEYPGLSDEERAPGSLVFTPTAGPVELADWRRWWRWVPGATWRQPHGPGPDAADQAALADHPVVQVAFADAMAYAAWAGKRLPTEAEHELAAQGGTGPASRDHPYAWGRDRDPGGVVVANTWRGRFPYLNVGARGWRGTSPVGTFPANPYGIYDLIGNVWEWTSDYYAASHHRAATRVAPGPGPEGEARACCSPAAADVVDLAGASAEAGSTVPRRVIKGGSHLCAPEYCLRYRPAARSAQAEDSATTHIGFRCARDLA